MKTTMNLPDALMAELKQRAHQEGRTVTSIVEETLRARLEQPIRHTHSMSLPTWDGGNSDGFLVDVDDSEAVWNALDSIA